MGLGIGKAIAERFATYVGDRNGNRAVHRSSYEPVCAPIRLIVTVEWPTNCSI
jgi:hypothetical protein